MSKLAEDDEEDDEARNPGDHFVPMHDLVAEQGHEEGACCDDDDTGISRDICVDCMDQLCTDDNVD